jgi:hypothetical protein
MSLQSPRLKRERNTIDAMIRIYCNSEHAAQGVLCADCKDVLEYAEARLARCPFQDSKPTCANCLVHCYKPDMRSKIRDIMRFAGPRMLLRHPMLAIQHLLDGFRKPVALKPSK